MKSHLEWKGAMTMACENRGLASTFDASFEHGGQNMGPTPKEMLLNSMSACSAMDVVSIAKKMRLNIKSLIIESEADKTDTTPSYFAQVRTKYFVEGEMEEEKIIKAVVLSMTKYCGVSYMINKGTPIQYQIYLNQKLIHDGMADFKVEVTHG